MHEVDRRIFEQVGVARVTPVDAEAIADFVQLGFVPLTDRGDVRLRMGLIDRNEFGPEAETDEADVNWFGHDTFLTDKGLQACRYHVWSKNAG